MAVNNTETDIWFAGQIAEDALSPSFSPWVTLVKHWNGTAWTTLNDKEVQYDRFRICRSSGWNNGLVFLQSHFDYETYRPIIGTIRTIP